MKKMNDDLRVAVKSGWLLGLDLAVAVSAGVAASQAVKLVRELRRHGAKVSVYLTPNANQFVGEMALHWASGDSVQKEFSAKAVHVFQHDMLLLAPATLNIIAEIASGLAGNIVTTMAQSLLGMMTLAKKKKANEIFPHRFLLAPAMHASLAANPMLEEALAKLESFGVEIVAPVQVEGKAKMANIDVICDHVVRAYYDLINYDPMNYGNYSDHDFKDQPEQKKNNQPKKRTSLRGKRLLITAGATHEKIDSVRVISNLASGRTGLYLARRAFHFGADVHLVASYALQGKVPVFIAVDYFSTSQNYLEVCESLLSQKKMDGGIFSAAVSDFTVKHIAGKIDSAKPPHLLLQRQKKIINFLHARFPQLPMVAFKLYAEKGPDDRANAHEHALFTAKAMLAKGCVAVVVNGVEALQRGVDGMENNRSIAREICLANNNNTIQVRDEEELCEALWQLF